MRNIHSKHWARAPGWSRYSENEERERAWRGWARVSCCGRRGLTALFKPSFTIKKKEGGPPSAFKTEKVQCIEMLAL